MTDRLSLANALAEARIDRPAAERIATEIYDAIYHNVATKTDLERVEERLRAATKQDLLELEHRLTVRFASVMAVPLGILFAALRYLPAPY